MILAIFPNPKTNVLGFMVVLWIFAIFQILKPEFDFNDFGNPKP